MDFELVGPITKIEPIAIGRAIRELARLRKRYGSGRWRKLKGLARVRLLDGTIHTAEIHRYEAQGIGRKELKIKFPLLGLAMKKRAKQSSMFCRLYQQQAIRGFSGGWKNLSYNS